MRCQCFYSAVMANSKLDYCTALLFFGLTGAREHEEVSFCFVPFCFSMFAGFVSGFHTS